MLARVRTPPPLAGSATRAWLGVAIWLLPGTARAVPEGTPDLGPLQGIEGPAALAVDVLEAGETIRVCSSDDGRKERALDGLPLDAEPVEDDGQRVENPVPATWRGRELLFQRLPDDFQDNPSAQLGLLGCHGDDVCSASERCLEVADGRRTCGQARAVTAAAGYCSHETGPGNWVEVEADEAGVWVVHLAGEPETLNGDNGRSTRFVTIDVLRRDGTPAPGGRVFSPMWMLNAHDFEYGADMSFFAVADVEGLVDGERTRGARVFVIDLDGMRGFRYQVVANRLGLATITVGGELDVRLARRSWCLWADPDPVTGECRSHRIELDTHALELGYRLYLRYPDRVLPPPPQPELTWVEFNDAVGTATITPNGDGVEDAGTFSFTSNLVGTYQIVIDLDRDGTYDPRTDRSLDGEASIGPNEAVWDGRGPDGGAVPAGAFPFTVALISAETHFPMVDIEDNRAGYVIWEQGGSGQERVPRRMHWNDLFIRTEAELVEGTRDARTSLPGGSAVPADDGVHQRRGWVQGDGDRLSPEEIYDTWVVGDVATAAAASCRRGQEPVAALVVGGADEGPEQDTDGDGLGDDRERRLGTRPDDPGTDGDGIPDGVEVVGQNRTLPRDPDTDRDGLLDGLEDVNANGQVDPGETDPTEADSDDDLLSDGQEDSDLDGRLDIGETDPRNPDTDGGGERDGSEVASGRNAVDDPTDDVPSLDVDDDGLSGDQERLAGTSAVDPDSDDDGLSDGEEVAGGSDPLDPGDPGGPEEADAGNAPPDGPAQDAAAADVAVEQDAPAPEEGVPAEAGCCSVAAGGGAPDRRGRLSRLLRR